MSEQDNVLDMVPELKSDTLKSLKDEADLLGVKYPNNANVSKMVELIDEHKKKLTEEADKTEQAVETATGKPASKTTQHVGQLRDEALKLLRCRITVNNPVKQAMEGQIITVGNDVVGTVSKFIPFQPAFSENGYHIPKIIVDYMMTMQHARYPKKKDKFGATMDDYNKARMVNDFTIEILPQLTPEELQELAEQQSATRSLDDDN